MGLWKAFRNDWNEFNKRIEFRIGNGRRVRLWKDRWCSEDYLEETFLELFSIASAKDA